MSNPPFPFPGPAVVVSAIGQQLAQGPPGTAGLQGPPGPAGLGTLQAYGADLFGSAATLQWVASISGQGGSGITVPVHAAGLQFDSAQTAPTISQAAAATPTTAPVSMFWAPQPPNAGASGTTFGTPASAIVSLAAPVGGGNHAGLLVDEGGTTFFRLDNGTVGSGVSALWLGSFAAAANSSNLTIAQDVDGGVAIQSPTSLAGLALDSHATDGSAALVTGTNAGGAVANVGAGIISSTVGSFIVAHTWDTVPVYVFQAGLLTASRRYTALNQVGAGITTTQLPANSGDGITWIGNRVVRPTVSPTLGAILFAEAGQLWIMPGNGSNTAFEILPATAAFVPDKDLNGAGTSTISAQYVSSLSFDSTGFVHGPVSAIPVNGTGAGLNWIDDAVTLQHVGTSLLQLAATTTDFLSFGSPSATSGFIRTPNNSIIVAAWSSGHSATMNLMSTDSSDNLTLGTGLFGGVRLANSAGTAARLDAGSSDFLRLGASPATFGYVRTPAAAASTGIVTAGAEYVLAWGAGSELAIGHFVNPTATMVLYFGGLLQFNDGASSTVAEFTSNTIGFFEPVDFDWVGNTSPSASTGGSGALPAQVAGYLNLQVSGVTRKFPFYVV